MWRSGPSEGFHPQIGDGRGDQVIVDVQTMDLSFNIDLVEASSKALRHKNEDEGRKGISLPNTTRIIKGFRGRSIYGN